jgi:hypothetical protein
MHPGLRVLIHSHQFRCVARLCEDKSPARALGIGGQSRRQFPPAARHTARTSCKHCGHEAPNGTRPHQPPSLQASLRWQTSLNYQYNITVCLSESRAPRWRHKPKAGDSPQPRDTSRDYASFSGKRPYTIITVPTPQVSVRRACQASVGPSGALPTPATEALGQPTSTARWWQSS